jgi:four helix bundle protein
MYKYSFEKLDVWIMSKELVKLLYLKTKSFPASEQFGLTNQIRRAAVSVASNIAEGCSRKTKREQARFTQIAYSSLMELLNQTIISYELDIVQNEDYLIIRDKIENLTLKLNALHNSQLRH